MKIKKIFMFFAIVALIFLVGIFPIRRNVDETYICTIYDSNDLSLGDIKLSIYGSEWQTLLLDDYFSGYVEINNKDYKVNSPRSKGLKTILKSFDSEYYRLSHIFVDYNTGNMYELLNISIRRDYKKIEYGTLKDFVDLYGEKSYFKSK